MNKNDLIKTISESTNLPKTQVGAVIDGFVDAVKGGLANGDKVSIPGVITFESRHKPASKGRNPSTGAEIQIPARNVVKIKAGKALSDAVA